LENSVSRDIELPVVSPVAKNTLRNHMEVKNLVADYQRIYQNAGPKKQKCNIRYHNSGTQKIDDQKMEIPVTPQVVKKNGSGSKSKKVSTYSKPKTIVEIGSISKRGNTHDKSFSTKHEQYSYESDKNSSPVVMLGTEIPSNTEQEKGNIASNGSTPRFKNSQRMFREDSISKVKRN
jgi:hypothetical protein